MAEGARLESVYTGNRIAGSNPAPSAILPISRQFASLIAPTGRADRAAPVWTPGGEFEVSPSVSVLRVSAYAIYSFHYFYSANARPVRLIQ